MTWSVNSPFTRCLLQPCHRRVLSSSKPSIIPCGGCVACFPIGRLLQRCSLPRRCWCATILIAWAPPLTLRLAREVKYHGGNQGFPKSYHLTPTDPIIATMPERSHQTVRIRGLPEKTVMADIHSLLLNRNIIVTASQAIVGLICDQAESTLKQTTVLFTSQQDRAAKVLASRRTNANSPAWIARQAVKGEQPWWR